LTKGQIDAVGNDELTAALREISPVYGGVLDAVD
jgi:hypothetical protein